MTSVDFILTVYANLGGMSESIDQIVLQDYQLIRRVGKGAYGVVYEGTHRISGDRVAIKKCFGCFQNSVDAQRMYREVSALMSMRNPNILELRDAIVPSVPSQDLYLITDFIPIDLANAMKSNILEDVHRIYITYQILCGLQYMHNGGLIHRDIKPSNILVDTSCRVKLCDFGLVRRTADTFSPLPKTQYVATRWYRAPELILGCTEYSFPVDIWATGALFAEMYTGKQLFPGTSILNQLERIIEFTGFPSDEELVHLGGMSNLALLQNVSAGLNIRGAAEFVPQASFTVLDILRQMLQFAPDSRVTASDGLEHGAFARFHFHRDEFPIQPFSTKLSNFTRLSPSEYQAILDAEIRDWRSHAKINPLHAPMISSQSMLHVSAGS